MASSKPTTPEQHAAAGGAATGPRKSSSKRKPSSPQREQGLLDFESFVAVPLEDTLTFARLLHDWFGEVATDPLPSTDYRTLTREERQTIAFGLGEIVDRLRTIDRHVSGPNGIVPR